MGNLGPALKRTTFITAAQAATVGAWFSTFGLSAISVHGSGQNTTTGQYFSVYGSNHPTDPTNSSILLSASLTTATLQSYAYPMGWMRVDVGGWAGTTTGGTMVAYMIGMD